MPREYDDHFGAYLFVCPDWAVHLEAYGAAHPGTVTDDLEGMEDLPAEQVVALELDSNLMDKVSAYGVVRYSHIDEGDDCCPTCGNEIEMERAVEVSERLARTQLKRLGQADLSIDAGL